VKCEKDNLLEDFENNLNRWKNYLSKIFSNIRQIAISTAEPLLLGTSHFNVQIQIETLKSFKLLVTDQDPAELVQGAGEILFSWIHGVFNSIRNKKELSQQWKRRLMKLTAVNMDEYHSHKLCTKFYPVSFSQG
jgi:hypothetical protein